jgi:hypothetical protein
MTIIISEDNHTTERFKRSLAEVWPQDSGDWVHYSPVAPSDRIADWVIAALALIAVALFLLGVI